MAVQTSGLAPESLDVEFTTLGARYGNRTRISRFHRGLLFLMNLELSAGLIRYTGCGDVLVVSERNHDSIEVIRGSCDCDK
jgi:hypothetical protein